MIDELTYKEIKRRIKSFVVLNNGYQFDDLFHDTIEKLIKSKKSNKDCISMCIKVAKNTLINYHDKCNSHNKYLLNYTKLQYDVIKSKKPDIIGPIKYKEMYILRYKFGFKHREISESLDMPLGTVKVKVREMKKELRRLNT